MDLTLARSRSLIAIWMVWLAMAVPLLAGPTEESAARLTGDFWKADQTQFFETPESPKYGPENPPWGFILDWNIVVPKEGWHELYLRGGWGVELDVFLDGKALWRYTQAGKDDKVGNIYLTAGKHVLRVARVGRVAFPKRRFDRFELVPVIDKPNASISAAKTDVDVMRVGEKFKFTMTAGGTGKPATYTLSRTNLDRRDEPAVEVANVSFAATSAPVTKTVLIDCPEEGAFALSAKTGDLPLSDAEFKIGQYAVVDVNHIKPASGKTTLIARIDCVEQTINGKPIAPEDFIEGNGPTRVMRDSVGAYRESHDCSPPQAVVPKSAVELPQCFSGFTYRIPLPQEQVPYLIEVDFPDNTRRSVMVIANWIDDKTGEWVAKSSSRAKSFETGGRYALTHQMQTHQVINWPEAKTLMLSVMTQEPGTRAAASAIRVSRFEGDLLPAVKLDTRGRRDFYHWYEEMANWSLIVGTTGLPMEQIVADMKGMDRWLRFVQYHGGTGVQGMGIGYVLMFWRSEVLTGLLPERYDRCRLLTLLCEKYGMKHMLEIFNDQWNLAGLNVPSALENPQDAQPTHAKGGLGNAVAKCDVNALHTGVQDLYVELARELNRKLGDSPAFTGLTTRADHWLFRGDFTLPSLYFGYNDWTIRQFESDTKIKVPGDASDPERFTRRFEFLTAPAMRERWIQWRCDRLLAYHKRFQEALAGGRKDIVFGISGIFATDPLFDVPEGLYQRAREAGVDLEARKNVPGLIYFPGAAYGSTTNSLAFQKGYDGFLDRVNVGAGQGMNRAFAAGMHYIEHSTQWPYKQLGMKLSEKQPIPYLVGTTLGAGRNSLEKYAVVLAEQDTNIMRDGGNTDIFAARSVYKPWFDTYQKLPAIPFEPVRDSLDQIAVWHGAVTTSGPVEKGQYFYVVNRTPQNVALEITLSHAKQVTDLSTDRPIALSAESKLPLTLAAFELRAFRGDESMTIESVLEKVPAERIRIARQRLAFAEDIRRELESSPFSPVTPKEKEEFYAGLDAAWRAMAQNQTWRTVVELSRPHMYKVCYALARVPDGMIISQFPNRLQDEMQNEFFVMINPMIHASELAGMQTSQSKGKVVASDSFNKDWRSTEVLTADDGNLLLNLEIPADGPYVIKLGQVSSTPGVTVASIDGVGLGKLAATQRAGEPETVVFPPAKLKRGRATLALQRQGNLGVYGIKIIPILQGMPSTVWSTVGPFKSGWHLYPSDETRRSGDEGLRATFGKVYPPETNPSLNATYSNEYGQTIGWHQDPGLIRGKNFSRGVDVTIRNGSPGADITFGQCIITSDRPRTAILYLPVDWWAVAYLNLQRVPTNIDKAMAEVGYGFTTHFPTFFGVLELKQGENVLLLKQLGGHLGTSWVGYMTLDDGLSISATPKKQDK